MVRNAIQWARDIKHNFSSGSTTQFFSMNNHWNVNYFRTVWTRKQKRGNRQSVHMRPIGEDLFSLKQKRGKQYSVPSYMASGSPLRWPAAVLYRTMQGGAVQNNGSCTVFSAEVCKIDIEGTKEGTGTSESKTLDSHVKRTTTKKESSGEEQQQKQLGIVTREEDIVGHNGS